MRYGLTTTRALPKLTVKNVNAIFSHVYDLASNESVLNEENEEVKDFLPAVLSYAKYVKHYRSMWEFNDTLVIARAIIGEFEQNSEGTDYYMALIIAIEELYMLSRYELISVLDKIKL